MNQLATLLSGCVILAGAIVVCHVDGRPSAARSFEMSIANGRFQFPNVDNVEQSVEIPVKAGEPVKGTFLSRDFVYTVELDRKGIAAVVLPNQTATMIFNLESGRWPIKIVQGCGRLFAGHEQQLVLVATE